MTAIRPTLGRLGIRPGTTRFRRALASVLAAGSLAAGATVAVSSEVGATTTPPCGSTPIAKSTGGYWSCTFDDEFTATTLDTSKWTPYKSVAGGFRGGDECYSPNNVRFGNGTLRLTATKSATTFDCAGRTSRYTSGLLLSKGKFSQAYGRFEMRAKIPAGVGFQPAFWLLPEDPYTQPGGYTYGEIDVMESWGNFPGLASPHLHYVITPNNPNSGAYCSVANMSTDYHTYTVEWTSSRMTFRYDGKTCWSTTWSPLGRGYQPAGSVAPSPFNQRFYLIVNLAMGGDTTAANRATSTTKFPSTMYVSYIRAWK